LTSAPAPHTLTEFREESMAEQTHRYETTVRWTEARKGELGTVGKPPIPSGAPPEFGGTTDVWSPEHLCVGAVNACVMLTFLTVAANSKVPIQAYSSDAAGTLEKVEGRGPVITRIVISPRITVGTDVDRSKVERLVRITERNCFVSNSMRSEISVQAEIVSA
jgi:organic hydroperoxide reductase OsmC/OhrA